MQLWLQEQPLRFSSVAPRCAGDGPRLAKYITPQTRGLDRVVRFPLVLGRGFALGWLWPHPYGWWRTSSCYGHAGNFSTVAWADPETGCAVAIVTNGNRSPTALVSRFAGIGSAIRSACR